MNSATTSLAESGSRARLYLQGLLLSRGHLAAAVVAAPYESGQPSLVVSFEPKPLMAAKRMSRSVER